MRLLPSRQRGQVAAQAALLIMLFVLLASALVDAYTLLEARNWGYQAAQQAALAGVSKGRDWASVTSPNAASTLLEQELALRGVTGYSYDIRVLPDISGGAIAGFPPATVRLGNGRGSWTSAEPAVGVYLSFPVSTFLLSFVGRPTVQIHVFASAGVVQPEGACIP